MINFENATNLNLIFNGKCLLESFLIAIFLVVICSFLAKKFFQIMQQGSYENFDYFCWLSRKGNVYKTKLSIIFMLSLLAYVLISVTLGFLNKWYIGLLGIVIFLFFSIISLVGDKKYKDKCPIKWTSRLIRLFVCNFVLLFIFTFILVILGQYLVNCIFENPIISVLRYVFALIVVLLIPQIIALSNLICKPFEKVYSKKYIILCKSKLEKNPNLIKIAITGSYGKTSVKNILATILSVKYNVLATPKSYNTPMGVCKAINQDLNSNCDVFICEMGARRKGDIGELCQMVKPNMGIITGVCPQHLSTFKTVEQIVKTKGELCEYLSGKIVALSADNEYAQSLKEINSNCQYVLAGLSDAGDIFAQDIEVNKDGSIFTLNILGEKIKCKTKLLGKHNISNICLAVAICQKLGLTKEEICQGIMNIEQVEHRLSVVETDKNFTIIDDSYNSNVVGYKAAIDVSLMFSKNLIVITPGLVEMGQESEKENVNFGAYLSKFASYVLLVGSEGAYNIRQGLLDSGFDYNKILMCKTLDVAKEKLNELSLEGSVVLFENDIPDKFL